MKKILTSIAMVLLLAGCAKQYDDSAIQTRIADLDRRVTALESSVEALRSAIGEGVFVAKVQELADPETGKTIGVTVTYTNGDVKYFEISPKADYEGPVVSIITNGAGDLVWAVDGVAVQVGGKDVNVYQTPVFSLDEEGYLWVEIDGQKTKLGQVQNEGATLKDGIFIDIKIVEDAEGKRVVLTLSDNSIVNIPFAETFKISIENNDIVYDKVRQVIEIPYTVSAKTAGTVVDVMGYDPYYFQVEVTEEKILVTPMTDDAAATMMVVADSNVGLVSIVKLSVSNEMVIIVDPEPEDVWEDYVIDSDGGTIVANIVSNVEIDAIPREGDEEWITIVETKAMNAHTITFTVAPNTSKDYRTGRIIIYKKGTDKSIHSLYVLQNGLGPKDLSKEGTANCYIVTAAGEYKFKAVKGNTAESVGTVNKAEIIWETYNNAEEVTANSVIAGVGFEDGYVYFATPATLQPGNALIAAKDSDGKILWSWHIWIPKTPIVVDETGVGGMSQPGIFDRNLGALVATNPAAEAADIQSAGLMYQWGRKDPFMGPSAFGTNSAAKVSGTAMTKVTEQQTEAWTIENPTVFVAVSSDWSTVVNNDIWADSDDKVKAVSDPCPAGYRVPQRKTSLRLWSGTSLAGEESWQLDVTNHWFKVGTPTPIVFPIAGYIYKSGEYDQSGTEAYIWTAHKGNDNIAYALRLKSDGSTKNEQPTKSSGANVRCVAVTPSSN